MVVQISRFISSSKVQSRTPHRPLLTSVPYHYDLGTFEFVEPMDDGELLEAKVFVTPEDRKIVRSQIQEAYDGISKGAFSQGCGEDDCRWCNFVAQNKAFKN